MPMAGASKETVIIVHGTWAAPDPVKRRWYEPVDGRPGGEPFPAKLDAALQERGSPARCWAHCAPGDQIFYWCPADNNWIARTRAAFALGDYVVKLRKEGWCCHIIAHSHGGNVVVEALPQIIPAPEFEPLGRIVTLGAPFMDTMSPILQRVKRRLRFVRGVSISAFAIVMLWLINTIYGQSDRHIQGRYHRG
jgi:hypothetical protein